MHVPSSSSLSKMTFPLSCNNISSLLQWSNKTIRSRRTKIKSRPAFFLFQKPFYLYTWKEKMISATQIGIVRTHWGRWWTLWSLWARLCCGPADGRRAGPGRRCVCRRPRGRAAQTALWTAPDRCGTAPGTAGSGRVGSWGYWCCPSNSWSDAQSEGHKSCTGHDTHAIHSMDV